MDDHNIVRSWDPLDNRDEYLYRIVRTKGLPVVHVHLSDAYEYSRAEYLSRPKEVERDNSFIMLALPHAHEASAELIAEARRNGLGIGHIGKFMGALNMRNVSQYETPDERRARGRQR